MEKDGEKYYRDLAQKVDVPGIKKILEMLANDEAKHFQIFQRMSQNVSVTLKKTDILEKARNIFQQMKESNQVFVTGNEQLEWYLKAEEIEKKSEDFYNEKANEVSDAEQKKMFFEIAREENRHYFLVDNIVNLIRAPNEWVENAEFAHLDEY